MKRHGIDCGNPNCPPPPPGREDSPPGGIGSFTEPIRDWLVANGVDWRQVAAWPAIEIDPGGGYFTVELIYHDQDGHSALMRGDGAGCLTRPTPFEYRVPIDPQLWEAYQHSRPHAAESAKWDRFERWLRINPPAISLRGGETLVWVIREKDISMADTAAMKRALEAELPGVNIVVVTGVDAVFAGPGPVRL